MIIEWLLTKVKPVNIQVKKESIHQYLFTVASLLGLLGCQLWSYFQEQGILTQGSGAAIFVLSLVTVLSTIYLLAQLLLPHPMTVSVSLISGYLAYLSIAQVIWETYQFNIPKEEHTGHFFQTGLLPLLIVLLCLTWTIWIFRPNQKTEESRGVSFLALAGFLGLAAVLDKRLLHLIFSEYAAVTKTPLSSVFDGLWVVLPWFLVLTSFAYGFIRTLEGIWKNRSCLSMAWLTSFLLAVFLNYQFQSIYDWQAELVGYYIVPGAMTYQIAFFTCFFFLVYVVLNRYLLTTLLLSQLAIILSVVNALKFSMRDEPLLVTDFSWISEIGLLTTFVQSSMVSQLLFMIIMAIVFYAIGRYFLLKGRLFKSLGLQLTTLTCLLVVMGSVSAAFQSSENDRISHHIPIISRLNNSLAVNWLGFTTNAHYKSLAFVWTQQLTKQIMEKPDGYNKETIEAIYRTYQEQASHINQGRPNRLTDRTIIYILSESFANPAYIPTVSLSEPVIPEILSLKDQTTSGLMTTNFYGGGTANMEFQSLTGLPFSNFSSSVSIAYTEVVPKMSFIPSISDLFEEQHRIAIHPSGANNYNRRTVYKSLRFDKFLAKYGSPDELDEPYNTGLSIADGAVYDNILKLLDTDNSQFFSAITMQNHAPWSVESPEQISASGQDFTEEENNNLKNYARLLYHTDQATKNFLETLKTVDKQVTVVFYGDHLPGLYPKSAFKDKPESQYQTDYFIWSNDQPDRKLDYPIVTSSDFTAELLEHTDSKVTAYQALLTAHLKEVGQGSSELTPEQEKIQRDLQMIQYDLTVGKGYILAHRDFFEEKD